MARPVLPEPVIPTMRPCVSRSAGSSSSRPRARSVEESSSLPRNRPGGIAASIGWLARQAHALSAIEDTPLEMRCFKFSDLARHIGCNLRVWDPGPRPCGAQEDTVSPNFMPGVAVLMGLALAAPATATAQTREIYETRPRARDYRYENQTRRIG